MKVTGLIGLVLGWLAVACGSRVDGGGKPAARQSAGPRDAPALPPAAAPEAFVPAAEAAGPPGLPDTSEGVPAAAVMPAAPPAEVEEEERDEARGFIQHWFDAALPSFCTPMPPLSPAARGPLSNEHATAWRELAPYIKKTLTRRDGGGDNRFLAFCRHAVSALSYNAMAEEALSWIVAQRAEDTRAAMEEALADLRQQYTTRWLRDGFPADVADVAWAILEADLIMCWDEQLNAIVADFKAEARSQWTAAAPVAAVAALAVSESKTDEDEEEEGDDDSGESKEEESPSHGAGSRRGRSSGASSGGNAKKRRK